MTPSEAKGSTYYQANYMSKNPFELNRTLPLLLQATEANQKYGSVADDHGSESRKAKNILQKVLNKQGWSEIGDQAAITVLGEKSYFTKKFTFVFIWEARKEWLRIHSPENDEEDSADPVEGSENIATESETGIIGVSQFDKYEARGPALAKIGLYDYASMIRTKKITSQKTEKTGPGRPRSKTFPFREGSKPSKCFEQIVSSCPAIPRIAGAGPPGYPGDPFEHIDDTDDERNFR